MDSTPRRVAGNRSPGRYDERAFKGAAEVLGFEQLGSTIMPNKTETVIVRGLTQRNPLDDEEDVPDFDMPNTNRQLLTLPQQQVHHARVGRSSVAVNNDIELRQVRNDANTMLKSQQLATVGTTGQGTLNFDAADHKSFDNIG